MRLTEKSKILTSIIQHHLENYHNSDITLVMNGEKIMEKENTIYHGSIQMYEQRNIDINKASVETLYSISKVLGWQLKI